MDKSGENGAGRIIPVVFAILGVIEVIISGGILISRFYGLTEIGFQLIVHTVIAIIWIVQGIIFSKKKSGNAVYAGAAIILLAISAYILLTIYNMTDYVVKSAEMEAINMMEMSFI